MNIPTHPVTTTSQDIAQLQEDVAALNSLEGDVIEVTDFVDLDRGRITAPSPNGTSDYTSTLVSLVTLRNAFNKPKEIYFPAGDYYFTGELPVGSSPLSIWDCVSLIGDCVANTAQHQEEGGGASRTRFIIALSSEADIWWEHIRDYRYGPIAFKNITFQLSNRGSLFAFGDMTNVQSTKVTLRGLTFDNCYCTRIKHYGADDIGDGRTWLVDADDDGYVLNKTNQSFAVRMSQCYDVDTGNLSIRGFKYGVINRCCDRPIGNIRAIVVGTALLEYSDPDLPTPVGGQWSNIWAENHILNGSVITSQVGLYRGEVNGHPYTAQPGIYDLPSSIGWSITAGEDVVEFTFPGDYDCSDYFEPRSYIELTPTQSHEPVRRLWIIAVGTTNITFANADGSSYVGRTISGDGSDVKRYFGIPIVTSEGMNDVVSKSLTSGIEGMPLHVAIPWQTPSRVGANCGGRNAFPEASEQVVICSSSIGKAEWVFGGIDFIGSCDCPDHPHANPGGIGPQYDRRIRNAIFDEVNRVFLFKPGRGVSSINDDARNLTFHPQTDNGRTVWTYRPSDSASTAWALRDTRLVAGVQTIVTIRTYVPSDASGGTSDVNIWAGATGVISETNLAPGWHTITKTIPAINFVADGNGPYIWIYGAEHYVAWVKVTQ